MSFQTRKTFVYLRNTNLFFTKLQEYFLCANNFSPLLLYSAIMESNTTCSTSEAPHVCDNLHNGSRWDEENYWWIVIIFVFFVHKK